MKYLILLFLLSCSTIHKPEYPNVDPILVGYVKKFNEKHIIYKGKPIPNNIKVLYQPMPEHPHAGGVHDRITKITIINKTNFENCSELTKESIVFHELGHHILHLTHDESHDRMMKNGCSRSIMYYRGVTDECYSKFKWYYIRELFDRSPAYWWTK